MCLGITGLGAEGLGIETAGFESDVTGLGQMVQEWEQADVTGLGAKGLGTETAGLELMLLWMVQKWEQLTLML